MADGRVVVDLILDSKGVVQGGRTATGEFVRVEQSAKKTEGTLGKLKGMMAGLVTVAALRQLATYAQRIFEIGTAAEETASKFATVFGPAAEALDSRLRELANAMGLTQTEARDFAATLGNVFQAQGATAEASAELSERVVRMAGDWASFHNVPVEQGLTAIQAALRGEFDPLDRFASGVRAATVEARALADSGKTTKDELSQLDRTLATLALASEGSGKAMGDLERTQDSTANSSRRLSAEIREQEERFARLNTVTSGYIVKTVADLLRANEEAGESFAVKLARAVLMATGRLVQMIGTVANTIRAFGNLGTAIGETVKPDGGISLFALQMNSLLGTLTIFEKRTLQGALAIRKLRKAWNEWTGDDKGADDQINDIEQLEKAIADADARLNTFGTQFAGGFGFLPSASLATSPGFQSVIDDFEELAGSLEDLPDIDSIIEQISNDLASSISDGGDRAAKARKEANEKAEQDRRAAIDQEFADRDLQIAAMAEGTDREVAEINLAFDRQREAYRRGYGKLTAEETAAFEKAQGRRLIQVRAAAASAADAAAGRVQGRRVGETSPSSTPLADERKRIKDFRMAMLEVLKDVEADAVDTSQTISEKVMGTLANTLSQIPPQLLSATVSLLGSFESLIDTQMGSLRDRTTDQVNALQDQVNALPRTAVAERARLEDQIAAIEQEAYAREKAMLAQKKRLAVAQVIAQTAIGVANALATGGPFPFNLISAAAVAAAGAAQVAAINSESIAPPRGASSAGSSGFQESDQSAGVIVGRSTLNATRPQGAPVNVNVQQGPVDAQVVDVKTDLQTVRLELRRMNARVSNLTGGRR